MLDEVSTLVVPFTIKIQNANPWFYLSMHNQGDVKTQRVNHKLTQTWKLVC